MIKVVLADDHEIVRNGIQMILETDPEIKVISQAADGMEAYKLVSRDNPDILLLDVSMPPGQSGMVACEKVVKTYPNTKVIILTMFAEPEYLLFTLRGGASGYVLKNSTSKQLQEAVHTVFEGGSYISPAMADLLAKHISSTQNNSASIQNLTATELEILELIARGFTNKEIADKVFFSVKTVEAHRSKIYKKLNLKTRADAVQYAIEHKILQFE